MVDNMQDALPPEEQKERYIHEIFSKIAPRYDFLNSLLSLRFDKRWRKFAAKMAGVTARSRILDTCTGTGDLALALSERAGNVPVVGSDFAEAMLRLGVEKAERQRRAHAFVPVLANSLELPFPDDTFDAVTVAFGLRNVADYRGGISEMYRVTKPGGRSLILEFTQPRFPPFRALYYFYFKNVLPRVGNAISKSREGAYSYLPASVLRFPDADGLAQLMRECGFKTVRYYLKTLGIVALHIGEK